MNEVAGEGDEEPEMHGLWTATSDSRTERRRGSESEDDEKVIVIPVSRLLLTSVRVSCPRLLCPRLPH